MRSECHRLLGVATPLGLLRVRGVVLPYTTLNCAMSLLHGTGPRGDRGQPEVCAARERSFSPSLALSLGVVTSPAQCSMPQEEEHVARTGRRLCSSWPPTGGHGIESVTRGRCLHPGPSCRHHLKSVPGKGLEDKGVVASQTPARVLEMEHLCAPQVHVLKADPQGDGIWRRGLWEVIRS